MVHGDKQVHGKVTHAVESLTIAGVHIRVSHGLENSILLSGLQLRNRTFFGIRAGHLWAKIVS